MVAGVVSAKVAALMEGVMMSMMLTKLSKVAVAGLVVLCLCGLGIGGYQALNAQETKTTITTTTTTTITKKSKTDPRLEGTWKPIRSEADGKLFPPDEDTSTFADGIFMQKKGVWVVAEAIYKTVIDPKGERNDIDLTFITGINRGKTLYYSYRIDGSDQLHWVGASEPMAGKFRPMTFSTTPGSQRSYVICQRATPQTTAKRAKVTEAAEEEQEETNKGVTAKECMKQLQGTWKYRIEGVGHFNPFFIEGKSVGNNGKVPSTKVAAEEEQEEVTALKKEVAVKEELVRLQGVWKPISAENEGKELDPKEDDWTLKFTGEKVVQLRKGKVHVEGKVELAKPTKTCKRAYWKYTNAPITNSVIYYFVGRDTLVTCWNGSEYEGVVDFPTGFTTGTPKAGVYLVVWKRQ